MILFRNFKAAMRLNRSKDMPVHVSTCASYDFNALTPVVRKVWRWKDMFLRLVAKTS